MWMVKYYLLTEEGYKNLRRIFNENEEGNTIGERFGIDVVELNELVLTDILNEMKLDKEYLSNKNPF
jgi:DNA-binding PadR family transcriptional regulator